jgi:hypothetical protein
MKIPIPDDWNGEEWRCVQINWPNSPLWLALLAGFMSTPSRGRFWDEDTGTITDIQAIGRAIFDRNYPLVACTDCSDQDCDCDSQCAERFGSLLVGEDDMGQVVTDVYIDDSTGELVVEFGPCCVHRYDIGAALTDRQTSPDDNAISPDDPAPSDIACQKAQFMAEHFVGFMQACFDEFPATEIFTWSAGIRDYNPNLDISNWSCYKLFQIIRPVWLVEAVFSSVWTSIDTDRLTCLWYPHLNGDDYSLSRAEYDAMHSALKNVGNAVMEEVVKTAFDALNYSNFQDMAAWSRGFEYFDCACPEPEVPDDLISRVRFTGEFSRSVNSAQVVTPDDPMPVDTYGRRITVQFQVAAGDWRGLDDLSLGLTGMEDGDYIKFRVWPLWANSGGSIDPLVATKDWQDSFDDMRNPALWFDMALGGTTLTRTIINNEALDHFMTVPTAQTQVGLGTCRCYTPAFPDTWFAFAVEIIQLNDTVWTPLFVPV